MGSTRKSYKNTQRRWKSIISKVLQRGHIKAHIVEGIAVALGSSEEAEEEGTERFTALTVAAITLFRKVFK